jgi:hypothetical protein
MKGFEEKWKIHKMGRWIDPESIIGSPYISGTDFGVKNESYTIESLDCALVAPYGRRLLQYGKIPSRQDLYLNLYNNIWNTNFPMWYEDDAVFRFSIQKSLTVRRVRTGIYTVLTESFSPQRIHRP